MFKKAALIPIVLFFLVFFFALVWASVIPPNNEAPDEAAHLEMIYFLKTHNRPPIFNSDPELPKLFFDQKMLSGAYYSMAYNSPLNYLPFLPFLRSSSAENTKFNLLPARVVSATLVSLFGVFLFFGLVNLQPKSRNLAAMVALFFALIPQVIFSAGYINIEPLALFFSALSFFLLTRTVNNYSRVNYLYLGFSLGFLALCKANYLIIVAVFGLYTTYDLFFKQKKEKKEKVIALCFLALPFLLLNLWWWIRNFSLYHDPLIFSYIKNQIIKNAPDWFFPPFKNGYNLVTILFKPNFAKFAYLGFFANLGGANIFLPLVFYIVFFGFLFFAVASALYFSLIKNKKSFLLAALVSILVVNLLIFANKNLYDFSPQGRHFFPMLPILALLVFFGLKNFKSNILPFGAVIFALVSSVFGLFSLTNQYYVSGAAYAMESNFGKVVEGFSWRFFSLSNYRNLLEYICLDNPNLFSTYFVLAYFLLFLSLAVFFLLIILRGTDGGK